MGHLFSGTATNMAPIIHINHNIFIMNDALQDCTYTHQSSSYLQQTTVLLLQHCAVARTATQWASSTLRTSGVNALPLLVTAGFSPPASESPI